MQTAVLDEVLESTQLSLTLPYYNELSRVSRPSPREIDVFEKINMFFAMPSFVVFPYSRIAVRFVSPRRCPEYGSAAACAVQRAQKRRLSVLWTGLSVVDRINCCGPD